MLRYSTGELTDSGKEKKRNPGKDQADAMVTLFWRAYVNTEVVDKDMFMNEMKDKYAHLDRQTSFRPTECHEAIEADMGDWIYYDDKTGFYGPNLRNDQVSEDLIRYRCGEYVCVEDILSPIRDRVEAKLDKTRKKTKIHGDHCLANSTALDMRYCFFQYV